MGKRKWIIEGALVIAALFVVGMFVNSVQESNEAFANTDAFLYQSCLDLNESAKILGEKTEDCEAKHLQ